jgi:hypothetical protein
MFINIEDLHFKLKGKIVFKGHQPIPFLIPIRRDVYSNSIGV